MSSLMAMFVREISGGLRDGRDRSRNPASESACSEHRHQAAHHDDAQQRVGKFRPALYVGGQLPGSM